MYEYLSSRDVSASQWKPAADVYQTGQGWIVKLEVAGIQPEKLHIAVSGKTLIIRGRRVDRQFSSGASCHLLEIAYSQFERRIDFPVELRNTRIDTEYRDGMLWIRIQNEGGTHG